MNSVDLNKFIYSQIISRSNSFFDRDLKQNLPYLKQRIEGNSVLVIGGAGTIGSSFIKALLSYYPGKLVVVDYNENGLTELTRDLRSDYNELLPETYLTYPFDFGSAVFEKMFHSNRFDIIACFAAHKHVRSEKDPFAIEAMINNNVLNTYKLLKLCLQNPPQHFFSVSTDKASNPVNVMGASKRLMEQILLAFGEHFKISTARFANVAFSNGSLLDGFNYRISKKQPISAPKNIKRYFVSPEESGQLCLLACILGNTKDIFFPKLDPGQMKAFDEIAIEYLKELGYALDYCQTEQEAREKSKLLNQSSDKYPIYFFESGTSGEKFYEEFYTTIDQINFDRFHALGVINNSNTITKEEAETIVSEISEFFNKKPLEKSQIVEFLQNYISDFQHKETGKNLDQQL